MNKFPRSKRKPSKLSATMIKPLQVESTVLQKLALELLRRQEAEGKSRSQIALELETSNANVSRWMNENRSNIDSRFVERIIQRYAKMDMTLLAHLLTALSGHQDYVKNIAAIFTAQDEDLKQAEMAHAKILAKTINR